MPSTILSRERNFHLRLLIPALAVLAFITIYPFIWMIVMSFYEVSMDPGETDVFVGTTNYANLTEDAEFIRGLKVLGKYVALCVSIEMLLGIVIALLVNRLSDRFQKWISTIFLMPMMVAPLVVGYLYYFLYNVTFGWYFWFLKSLGIIKSGSILADTKLAFYGVVAADVWEWTPLVTLIVLAGLKKVPQDQIEAARVDGASRMRILWDVTFPNLHTILLVALLIRFMDNIRYIDLIYVLTGGGPADTTKILPFHLYNIAFRYFEFGRSAAVGIVMLAITIGLAIVFVSVFNKIRAKGAQEVGG